MSAAAPAAHFLAAVVGQPGGFELRIARTAALLASAAHLAGDSRSRRRGLLGATGLPAGAALVIAPTQGIHTVGMRFPIDVIFADRHGRVVRLAPEVPPWRCRLSWRAFAAVELPSGTCHGLDLSVGDLLEAMPASSPAA